MNESNKLHDDLERQSVIIGGLHRELGAKERRIAELEAQVARLQAQLAVAVSTIEAAAQADGKLYAEGCKP